MNSLHVVPLSIVKNTQTHTQKKHKIFVKQFYLHHKCSEMFQLWKMNYMFISILHASLIASKMSQCLLQSCTVQ